MPKLLRSFLFVPADRPDRIEKAAAMQADVVVVELEDGGWTSGCGGPACGRYCKPFRHGWVRVCPKC